MDEIGNERLEEVLQEAFDEVVAGESPTFFRLSSALKKHASGGRDDPINALAAGVDYHFIAYPEQRDERGPFGPMMEADGVVYPTLLGDMPTEVLELWARAVEQSPVSALRARFSDLLWERRYGDEPYEWCASAIDLYLKALDEGFGHPTELMEMGTRAFELAKSTNNEERRLAVEDSLKRLISASLEDSESPGVALPLLELLASQPTGDRTTDLEELVDGAIEVYGGSPFNLKTALDIKARLVDEGERDGLWLAQVEAFQTLAGKSTGIARYAHLQSALEMSIEKDLTEKTSELRKEIEGITEEELGLKEISVEIEIPREEIDAFVSALVGEDDLKSALSRFGTYTPLEEPEESAQFVEELLAEHPLQSLVSRMTIGPSNAMLRKIETPDDHREAELIAHQTRQLAFFGYLSIDILEGIRHKYGEIGELTQWLESLLVEQAVAERIVDAIALYEAGDHDSSASVLTPRLERMIRRTAQAIGLPTTGPLGRGTKSSGVRTLGALLESMRGFVPERTYRYLALLLTEPTGLNLRNRISHGLVDSVAQPEAALLIHAVCHLSMLVPVPDEQRGESS